MAAVYLTHFAWVQPSIYFAAEHFAGEENIYRALMLPWTGEEWALYPLIDSHKSALHLIYLVLYWALFSVIALFGKPKEGETKNHENLAFTLSLCNHFVFAASFVHHLHVYYPGLKYLFPIAMGLVEMVFFLIENRRKRTLLAELYLVFAVSSLVLAFPMYFDGPWITYGWATASVLLSWLGFRHGRKILRILSWVVSGCTVLRLIHFDYLEDGIILNLGVLVRYSFFLFTVCALAFGLVYLFYRSSASRSRIPEEEQRIVESVFLILSLTIFYAGILLGGLRAAGSFAAAIIALALFVTGVTQNRLSHLITGVFYSGVVMIRIYAVESRYAVAKLFTVTKDSGRLWIGIAAIAVLFAAADWLRQNKSKFAEYRWILAYVTALAAFTLAGFLLDDSIASWVAIAWGTLAFALIIAGFLWRERVYRWTALVMFVLVLARLFLHDFSALETIYKIISFMAIGAVLIIASFLYSYYSKLLLEKET